jgi:hypothetical protein
VEPANDNVEPADEVKDDSVEPANEMKDDNVDQLMKWNQLMM